MEKIKVKIRLMGGKMPIKVTPGSAGYDIYTPEDVIIKPGRQVVPIGFAIELPCGFEAMIQPRSGFSSKGMEGYALFYVDSYKAVRFFIDNPIHVGNDTYRDSATSRFDADVIPGKVDADYRGCVGIIVNSNEGGDFFIPKGTRLAQMTIYKAEIADFEESETLSETTRADQGFGHSKSM